MSANKKISSVLEIARYDIGTAVWWVVMRPSSAVPELSDEDLWMSDYHPKILYTRGPCRKLWPKHTNLPKLQHLDFQHIVGILNSELVVEQFKICNVIRSYDTGEFFYCNDYDEWMPENYLMDSKEAATKEKNRILRILRKWTDKN